MYFDDEDSNIVYAGSRMTHGRPEMLFFIDQSNNVTESKAVAMNRPCFHHVQ